MIAFAVGEPEQTFFQDGIPFIPEGQSKAQPLLVIADAAQAIFAPPVSPGAGLVMGEIVPRVAILAVVFADCAPLPLAQVRSPFFPRDSRVARVIQPFLFGNVNNIFDGHEPLSALLLQRREDADFNGLDSLFLQLSVRTWKVAID